MPLELLIRETQGLSNEAIMEVVRFVRFMKTEAKSAVCSQSEKPASIMI